MGYAGFSVTLSEEAVCRRRRGPIEPLLPQCTAHPFGCYNPRVDDRRAIRAILFQFRTGCRSNALSATGLCSSSSAHRRFQEWRAASVFRELWWRGATEVRRAQGVDCRWLAPDGALPKAPLREETPLGAMPRTVARRARSRTC